MVGVVGFKFTGFGPNKIFEGPVEDAVSFIENREYRERPDNGKNYRDDDFVGAGRQVVETSHDSKNDENDAKPSEQPQG